MLEGVAELANRCDMQVCVRKCSCIGTDVSHLYQVAQDMQSTCKALCAHAPS